MEYSDKNEHLNDDPLENKNNTTETPTGSENDPSPANPPEKSKEVPGKSEGIPVPGDDKTIDLPEQDEHQAESEKPGSPGTKKVVKQEPQPGQEEAKEEEQTLQEEVKEEAKEEDQPDQKEANQDEQPEQEEAKEEEQTLQEEVKEEAKVEEPPAQEEAKQEDQPEQEEAKEEEQTLQEEVKEEEQPSREEAKEEDQPDQEEAKKEEQPEQVEANQEEQPEQKREHRRAPEPSPKEKPKHEEIEEEKVNYELLSKSDIVKLLHDLLNSKTFDQLRNTVDEIQEVYQKKVEQEYAEKKEKFIAEGGLEQDFKPVDDPVDKQMEELLEKFKVLKADFNKQLEAEKETNLKAKEEILEEFRLLMEGQEGFDTTFRKFKQLQKRWFDVGIVPKQNVRDLWNSYNFFVDKFNDYVRINKELRVLDLKKNLDLKLKLCEKAEELAEEKNISNAFKILQKYHAQWRDIGPVPREDKDTIWERFKAATSVINKAHQHFQSELKDSLVENLEKKTGLCEKAEAIAALDLDKHSDWVQKTNELLAIQKEWKTIGYAPKKDNNQIYARFRRACDTFFDRKASFYAKTFEHQKENLEKKLEVIRLAEELKESKEWKSTTDKLIDLQKQWKEIGPVPRKESDKLWRRFRSACDHFFNAKSEFFGGKNESYEENLEEKKALIEEMNKFDPPESRSELISALEDFQTRYNEIGFVPVEVKDKIRDDFKDAVNEIVDKTNESEEEKLLMRYRIRIAAIMNSPRSENKIRFERDKLMNKLQQLRNDIGVWENNIGFFKQTESSEDTLSEFNEKIEDAHNRINQLEQKIRIIDELDDSM